MFQPMTDHQRNKIKKEEESSSQRVSDELDRHVTEFYSKEEKYSSQPAEYQD
jgi:hypothetical protein